MLMIPFMIVSFLMSKSMSKDSIKQKTCDPYSWNHDRDQICDHAIGDVIEPSLIVIKLDEKKDFSGDPHGLDHDCDYARDTSHE